MRKLPVVTIVGLIVFIVAGIGAGIAWERHGNADQINLNRRDQIQRAFEQQGPDSGVAYGLGFDQADPDAWLAAALVLGCAALCGALSAAAGYTSRS